MRRLKKYLFMILAAVICIRLSAQTGMHIISELPADTSIVLSEQPDKPFTIREIFLTGNRKTKKNIILRELPFGTGDAYSLNQLVERFEEARRRLINTSLFNEVVVALKQIDGYLVDIEVDVKERWYFFPIPYFKVVDRNINQWLVEQNASLSRIDYGAKLLYNNATGNNDKLNLWLINGYTKQISAVYDRLYIDRKMNWGLSLGIASGKNREVNYSTAFNKQLFYKDTNNFIRSFFRTNAELTYRRAIKTRHRFGIGYSVERVSDTILKLNPTYFKNKRDKIVYPEIYYKMTYQDVDYIPYPLTGYMAELQVSKKGFNNIVNLWQVSASLGTGWRLGEKTYLGTRFSGMLKLPFRQPFYNQRLLGYQDFFMQGYEYYVMDGAAGGYMKTTLTRELFNHNFYVKRKKDISFQRIPLRIYGKVFGNGGITYHPSPGINPLNNKLLFSWGFGIDIISHYDFTLKLEWSFNQLGENGLYLHRKSLY